MPAAKIAFPLGVITALALITGCGGGEQPPDTVTPAASPTPTFPPPAGSPASLSTPLPAERTIDLSAAPPALTILGADTGDFGGDIPPLALGDFNDDDILDVLIGARFGDGPDNARQDAGEAYVLFGSSDLKGSIALSEGAQDITIYGEKPEDGLGSAVAAADVNGDGIDDILVSSPFAEGPPEPRTNQGEAYVIFGSPNLGGTLDIARGDEDVKIIAAEGLGAMGDTIAAGDVNADGIDDILLGAPFAGRDPGVPVGGPRSEEGRIYVFFGSPDLRAVLSVRENDQDFMIIGGERRDETGDALAVGDVNGDGVADIIVTAETGAGPDNSRPKAGEVHVFFGSLDLPATASVALGDQDLTILGAEVEDTLGFSVATGDIDGDGFDDIVIGAKLADGPQNARRDAGEVYIVFGAADLSGVIDVALDEQDSTIYGGHEVSLFGTFVAVYDVDGDGLGDLVLGTPFAPSIAERLGRVEVIFGSEDRQTSLDLSAGGQDLLILGQELGDMFGGSAVFGDIDDDGQPEMLVFADNADGPSEDQEDVGKIYGIDLD